LFGDQMKVKKYGKQGFFNPVDSDDDGSYKLSVRPAEIESRRPQIYFKLRDCSKSVKFDLDTEDYDTYDGQHYDPAHEIDQAKRRLKKIKKMRRVFDEFLGHAEKTMIDYVEFLESRGK